MHDPHYTDLTKAVMTDESGKWHLVPADAVNDFVSAGRNSVVVHQCPQWSEDIRSPIKNLPYEPLGYWTVPKDMTAPCKLCEQRVPEKIANLFMLHNFDTFAGDQDGMNRIINTQLTRTFALMKHAFTAGTFRNDEPPCRCVVCVDQYGGHE